MMEAIYIAGNSPLHRLAAGIKLASLVALGTGIFVIDDLAVVAAVFAAVAVLYAWARIPARVAVRQLRFAVPLLAVILVAQGLLVGWDVAVLVVLRFATLILFASLVTLTTRSSDMIDALERLLRPLQGLGVDVRKTGLSLSLALRFIPVVAEAARQVREAQRARGLERNIVALAVPVVIRLLRMADDVAEAIEARGFDAEGPRTGPGKRSGT